MQVGRCFFPTKTEVFEGGPGEGVKIWAEDIYIYIYIFFLKGGGIYKLPGCDFEKHLLIAKQRWFSYHFGFLGFPQVSSHQRLLFTFVFECGISEIAHNTISVRRLFHSSPILAGCSGCDFQVQSILKSQSQFWRWCISYHEACLKPVTVGEQSSPIYIPRDLY